MQELANVYARSLFEVAREQDKLDEIHEQLGEFADAVSESRNLQVFLFSPYFSSQEKKDGIRRIVEGADERLLRFLELLAEKHRMPVIFRIRRAFDEMWADANRLLEASVTSAVELDEKIVKQIGERDREADRPPRRAHEQGRPRRARRARHPGREHDHGRDHPQPPGTAPEAGDPRRLTR